MKGLTCPNGHAMDEGLFECPACGAYRPSVHGARSRASERLQAEGLRMMLELGMSQAEACKLMADARRAGREASAAASSRERP